MHHRHNAENRARRIRVLQWRIQVMQSFIELHSMPEARGVKWHAAHERYLERQNAARKELGEINALNVAPSEVNEQAADE